MQACTSINSSIPAARWFGTEQTRLREQMVAPGPLNTALRSRHVFVCKTPNDRCPEISTLQVSLRHRDKSGHDGQCWHRTLICECRLPLIHHAQTSIESCCLVRERAAVSRPAACIICNHAGQTITIIVGRLAKKHGLAGLATHPRRRSSRPAPPAAVAVQSNLELITWVRLFDEAVTTRL